MPHVLLVFQRYDPNFLAGSLDEAYLDITNFCNDKQMTGGEVNDSALSFLFLFFYMYNYLFFLLYQ